MSNKKSVWQWVFPTALILFICTALTLPLILVLTYAGNSAKPLHTLELRDQHLTWGSETDVREDGSADLSLFSAYYDTTVLSENEDRVLAPGTAAETVIKFINKSGGEITYFAYLYEGRSDPDLPVTVNMSSSGSTAVGKYDVPDLLEGEKIVKVLKGTVTNDTVVDFAIDWNWIFEVSDEQDVIDTYFGDKAAFDRADDITVGFYIVVEDDGGNITPDPPPTGDHAIKYVLVLLIISAVVMVIAFIGRKKEKKVSDLTY